MPNRNAVTVGVMLSIAVVVGCSARVSAPLSTTASVIVNGMDAKMQIVRCHQLEWYRTIELGGAHSGA